MPQRSPGRHENGRRPGDLETLTSALPDREIRAGNLALDPDTHTLHKGETAVQLCPKEAALLAVFMCNPGWVLSHREIMKEVWEREYLGDTRTHNVHVCWLRLKIEDEPTRPRYRRTVRGVGHRLDLP